VNPPREPVGTASLSRLIGDSDAFRRHHWQQDPLLIHAPADGAERFCDLLSTVEVDELVTRRGLRRPFFRMVRDGDPIPPTRLTRTARAGRDHIDDLVAPAAVAEQFLGGATLVLQSLHRLHPPLVEFCQQLAGELGHSTQCNAYLTPPMARGFAPHFDTHDVFVLQVSGTKRWTIHPPVLPLPLDSQGNYGRDSAGQLPVPTGEPALSTVLEPGDVLYLPRGYVHSADGSEEISLHLTVGVLLARWHGVLAEIVALAQDEEWMREALPLDAGKEEFAAFLTRTAEWMQGLDPGGLAEKVADGRSKRQRSPGPGPIAALEAVRRVGPQTRLVLRTGKVKALYSDGDQVLLELPDRTLQLPLVVLDALRFLVAAGSARPDELAGDGNESLDGAGALVLVRRLIREGVLDIASPAGPEDTPS
jgi:lysine-specific demethylase/histidyl-hydroxylase NO66